MHWIESKIALTASGSCGKLKETARAKYERTHIGLLLSHAFDEQFGVPLDLGIGEQELERLEAVEGINSRPGENVA